MNLTVIFMITMGLIIGLFDVWVILKKGKQESISAHVIRGSKKYPLVVLLFGILLGHLFWNMPTESVDHVKCKPIEVINE